MNLLGVETVLLGINNLRLHKLRSLLTALGIIFGVAAVICMLSISEGASADELRMIELLGTQNIIVNSIKPEQTTQASEGTANLLEYGITQRDVQLIRSTVPHVRAVIPLKTVAYGARFRDQRLDVEVVGTTDRFFEAVNVQMAGGRVLTAVDLENRAHVCVIGDTVRRRLFAYEDPLGQLLVAERYETSVPYRVVGVLAPVLTAGAPARGVEERDLNREIFIPFTTAASRYGPITIKRSTGSRDMFRLEYSSLYITADELDHVLPVSQMVSRVLEYHHEKLDYEVKVPLARLQLAEKKKMNQQIVLGVIAGISLLVGGIGIMNIMLATVTERTREIGIRRALGARQRQIAMQFLVETVVLTTCGGLVGIALGCVAAYGINRLAEWETIVQTWTIVVSFTLSVMVGIFFGMYPAMSAASMDPIEALRHE